MQTVSLMAMLLREWVSKAHLERRPEPELLMDSREQVDAFHAQGAQSLIPIYHFNALGMSRLVPRGGTVVDLGSGTAFYLGYLARCRPDLRIIGVELAPTMVEVGEAWLAREGLSDRVKLRVGDMTRFTEILDEPVHLVSSVFSLHHLPTQEHVLACLRQAAMLRNEGGCALWIFDHVRPKHPMTPQVFPQVFTPTAAAAFNEDSANSLIASWSFEEMLQLLGRAGLKGGTHYLSRLMRFYQVHRFAPLNAFAQADLADAWREPSSLSVQAEKDLKGLQWLFPRLPS